MITFSQRDVSHSALNDMRTIEQENLHSSSGTLSSLGKLRISDSADSILNDYTFGGSFGINRGPSSSFYGNGKIDSLLGQSGSSSGGDSWVIVDDVQSRSESRVFEGGFYFWV